MGETVDSQRFFERLGKIQTHWLSNKTAFDDADALCICYGARSEELEYSKFSTFHLYLYGFEFPDSITLITKDSFYFMATPKKCNMFESLTSNNSVSINLLQRSKDEGVNRENLHKLINAVRKTGGKKIGSIFKFDYQGSFIPSWIEFISNNQLDKAEISPALGIFFSKKDENEIELCKRASVLSNKVLKHGFVTEMEAILDKDQKVKHSTISDKLEAIITDPSKINLKVSKEVVEICYSPIIQSGGEYDIRINAVSNDNILSSDVIICSLGARYKNYCANIARTFLVDAPPKVEQTYGILLSLYNTCLEAMVVGNELKDVSETAKKFLVENNAALLAHLPKTFGFAIGVEFRDSTLVLNATNSTKFTADMFFTVIIGFHHVPLSPDEKVGVASGAIKKLNVFSLLLSDTVKINETGPPEVLTKISKEFNDISYNLSDKDGEQQDEEDIEAAIARRETRHREQHMNEATAVERSRKQKEIIEKRLEESRVRASLIGAGKAEVDAESLIAKNLQVYNSPSDYPGDVVTNQVKLDMNREAIFIPINGQAIPFHISMIKSVVLPGDVKNVSYMRINFYTSGGSLAKDVPKNTQLLIAKYGRELAFLKEVTLRSLNPRHFSSIHAQFQELRRRIKQREQKAEQEKDLVQQAKLIRIKDQRIPRLQDVKLTPPLSGQKCIGTMEAHQNGLRFTSTKGDLLDILYSNIKHCIFQPCDRTTVVLIHFHLKDFIIVGKKKQKDIQIYTDVVESSLNLDGARRYSHDIDELDEEQREREMRKRLNLAFKEFAIKLEKLAEHYEYHLAIETPYKKVGFHGNASREMVYIQPTINCLVNLTEKPPFLLTLSEVEHVHFERVTFGTRNFDLTFIFKNWEVKPRTITSIDLKSKEMIQDWLNLVEIPHTIGTRAMNWTETMNIARLTGPRFYETTDEDGVKKPAGWTFLSAEDDEEEEEEQEEEDSEYSEEEEEEESEGLFLYFYFCCLNKILFCVEDDESDDYADEEDDDDDDEDDDEEDDYDEEEVSYKF